ncbi:hypothetical protein Mal64_09810 [Pseudobythopirellula maris]|uniref:Uncharacterized protein n=1 Tax=Pseudobythopirellula maris TaxID=2527991 RepID=A0A5C5ZU87_9BACT|nr:hypothetical protein [Pseudobythopirellula maris]TWT90587.1 hypothetical protein Mal64_09810 [Pseudobythopirellula maris]
MRYLLHGVVGVAVAASIYAEAHAKTLTLSFSAEITSAKSPSNTPIPYGLGVGDHILGRFTIEGDMGSNAPSLTEGLGGALYYSTEQPYTASMSISGHVLDTPEDGPGLQIASADDAISICDCGPGVPWKPGVYDELTVGGELTPVSASTGDVTLFEKASWRIELQDFTNFQPGPAAGLSVEQQRQLTEQLSQITIAEPSGDEPVVPLEVLTGGRVFDHAIIPDDLASWNAMQAVRRLRMTVWDLEDHSFTFYAEVGDFVAVPEPEAIAISLIIALAALDGAGNRACRKRVC